MNFKKRITFATIILSVMLCAQLLVVLTRNTNEYYWSDERIKDIKHYISEKRKPILLPKNFCMNNVPVVVIVNDRLASYYTRNIIRNTWGIPRENVSIYFLVGQSDVPTDRLQEMIEEESIIHDDIIQEHFIDSYENLTLKAVNMLKLFNMYCSKSKYLIKVDDDVYLNLPRFLEMLLSKTRTDYLAGQLYVNSTPQRHIGDKWYVPYEIYPDGLYPPYVHGITYVMSSDVVTKLYKCALETPLFHLEDVFITGICAKKTHVTPTNDPNILAIILEWSALCSYRNDIYSVVVEDIWRAFYIFTSASCSTTESYISLESVFYLVTKMIKKCLILLN